MLSHCMILRKRFVSRLGPPSVLIAGSTDCLHCSTSAMKLVSGVGSGVGFCVGWSGEGGEEPMFSDAESGGEKLEMVVISSPLGTKLGV